MPEPAPMSSTRSAARSESSCVASVKGMVTGPMFPGVGNVTGTRDGSMPTVRHIAVVCAWETWWAT
jgi:hypothetical protein